MQYTIREALAPSPLSKQERTQTFNQTLSNALFYVASGVALMYVGLTIGHILTLPDDYRTPLIVAALSGLFFQVSLALWGWRHPVPPRYAHLIATLLIATVIINSALHLALSAEEKNATNIALIIVSAGCFFLSCPWWLGVVTCCIVSWALISYAYIPSPDWVHFGFLHFICFCLSAIVILVRRTHIVSYEQLRIAERARVEELEAALRDIKVLEGLIPICAWCKNIRDDEGFWREVETFVSSKTAATFSHGLCPTCNEKHFSKVGRKHGTTTD